MDNNYLRYYAHMYIYVIVSQDYSLIWTRYMRSEGKPLQVTRLIDTTVAWDNSGVIDPAANQRNGSSSIQI